jgi:hypothetical protein
MLHSALVLAFAVGCGSQAGPTTSAGTETQKITAADVAGNERAFVDMTSTRGVVVDGRSTAVDLARIDVKTADGVAVLDKWLTRESNLAPAEVSALGRSWLELSVYPAAYGTASSSAVGQVSEGLAAAPCTANICCDGCDPPGAGGDSSCCVYHPRPTPP